ncbi:TPA: hypothetical protein NJ279_004465 [Vibrio parahaemolyticus]|uniref:hypothetical protein n=1 Tax=Vibrio harveyi group TaxID=717610 RepID=UPI0006A57D74|nr:MULTISPECIES: hypothetical protein [Vibrio harveyi group]EGQ9460245.1 hypothetical protein [Vibrio parahaemolyticus]EJE4692251.1 hypothetical protein [Vibrio parahaemolyticus]EJK2426748.1 hypothetical protein [Vibrio parahaemolyticus]EJO3864589.1 hypothetical protein [Vibrio parahaemolyticus]ELB2264849.1 hypothetical protein [Vibrio parahaemolyticus]
MKIDEYQALLSGAYNCDLSRSEKEAIRKKLLGYKSQVLANGSSCPKEVEDAIKHLGQELAPTKLWSTWTTVTKISASSSIVSVLGIFISIASITLGSVSRDESIESKINELDQIQTSLQTLSNYVDSQKSVVQLIARETEQLESERDQIKQILELDQSKLDAMFAYQNKISREQAYFEYFISFLIGVLSSSAVVLVGNWLQNKKKGLRSQQEKT